MGTKKSDDQLKVDIQSAGEKIVLGGVYQHYKCSDKQYKILGFATFEATNELCVIYKALYGAEFTFVRQVSIWLETVEWESKTVPRFSLVSDRVK